MPELLVNYARDGETLLRTSHVGQSVGRSVLRDSVEGAEDGWDAWHSGWLRGAKPRYELGAAPAFRVLDLFSGAGGLALGALDGWRSTGLRASVAAALDADGEALEIYERNLAPEHVRRGDVATTIDFQVLGSGGAARFAYPPRIVDTRLAARLHGVSAIVAGPPCQGHSNLNNHTRRDDVRNRLYLAVPAFAVASGATVVVIENVPEVVRDRDGVVSSSHALLHEAGWSIAHGVLDASDFGWPQRRRRYFLVGVRDGQGTSEALAPLLRSAERPVRDLRWCIGDLAGLENELPFHKPATLSDENKRRIAWLFENGKYELDPSERPLCHRNGTTYGSVYGRLKWEEPAFTITTGFLTPGRGRYVHPSERRTLTPREAARIQGFPDWFDFRLANGRWPSNKTATKVIGDAVPPILGHLAALVSVILLERAALAGSASVGQEPAACEADAA